MANPPVEPPKENRSTSGSGSSSKEAESKEVKGQFGLIISQIFRLFGLLPRLIWRLLMLVADLQETTDMEKTIRNIKEGIRLKGYNMWILVASAVLASIGLDQNSGAVIIGAMLISPLMSPILGIGLSVGMYDRETLRDSLKNFLIAIGLSLATSTLYFLITPLGDITPELAARTRPNLLDVGVAFFGGVAGIVAGSRKDITNAIPGVAIATALMPPVCTAGFGLATFNFPVFFGALYLFFLNAVFISLSTFVIVRFLKFPVVASVDNNYIRRIFGVVSVFMVIIVVPSIILLVQLVQEQQQKQNLENFVQETLGGRNRTKVIGFEYEQGDSLDLISVTLTGEFISPAEIDSLSLKLDQYHFKNCRLEVFQTKDDPDKMTHYRTEIDQVKRGVLANQKLVERQQFVVDSVLKLIGPARDTLPFATLKKEVNSLFPEMQRFAITKITSTDFKNRDDTTITAMLQWQKGLQPRTRREMEKRLYGYLAQRLKVDTLYFMHYD